MLGHKIYKPLQDDFISKTIFREVVTDKGDKINYPELVSETNNAPNTFSKYTECTNWCANNNATIVDNGDFYEVVEIPVYVPTKEELASQIRSKRDYLLEETDYLLAPDYPISPEDLEAVKVYRQALRDVPQQETFPSEVIWPEKPVIQKL